MKKIIKYLIVITILLFTIVSPIMANTQNIGVDNVLSGANTNPGQPGLYLIDNDLDTHWAFSAGKDYDWAEIILNRKTLIQAIELEGYLAPDTELKIEYFQGGHWLPFMAPTVKELGTERLIDLSYDQVVSSRIRLTVSGNGLSSSYLAELKVLGIPAEEYYHRINPVGVTASDNTDPAYKAEFLSDGNTYTLWKTVKEQKDWQDRKFDEILDELSGIDQYHDGNNGNNGNNSNNNRNRGNKGNSNNQQSNAEVEFNLGEVYKLDNVKLYLTDHLKGSIEFHTYQNGDWQYLDSLATIPEGLEPGWFRLNIEDRGITTERVKVIVTGYGGELGGISEVEFWGTGKYYGETPKLIGIQEPQLLDKEINSQFEIVKREIKNYTLELAVKGDSNQKLKLELNGNQMELEPAFSLRGYTIYKKELTKEDFWIGENYLKVYQADNLALVNSRLSSIVRTKNVSQVVDGLLFESPKDSREMEVNLSNLELSLPPFPEILKAPYIPGNGSRKIEDWNAPVVIDQDQKYDTLTVNTELKLDTSNGDINLIVKNLQIGSNASISITGNGRVNLFIDNDLNIRNGSRINSSGKDESMSVYHTGNRIDVQGGVGGQGQYKLVGDIYTEAADIFIQNGASFKGKLYALNGDITIRGGITASELLYAKKGNITITGGANVSGRIISAGNKVEIYGGSTFDGSGVKGGLFAPYADIYIDQGATIKGEISARANKVHIGNINHQHSFYKIPEIKNFENKYLEEVTVYSTIDNPIIYLYAWIDNNWVEVYQTAEGLKSSIFKEYLRTDKLLIKNPEGVPITEVTVKYSTENNREPGVEILQPADYQQLTHQELSRDKVIAFVDNPDTEVSINGQNSYHRGHYFWLEANRVNAGSNKANQITAVAKDSLGRVNYDTKTIYVGNQTLLDVNLADEIIYTEEAILTLNGTIKHPLNKLEINGEPVNISGQNFSKDIELGSGLNLIKIEGTKTEWQGKKEFSNIIYRKVVKTTPVSLIINSPLDGYYTNQDSIVVSGIVNGLGELSVKVNEIQADQDGAVFTSQPVELDEGSNIISIIAFNNSGRIEKEITVIKDTTAPVLSDILPEDSYISNASLLTVTGQVTDLSPVQVYVNNKVSSVNDTSFINELTLIDGHYPITVKAVDMAGNQAYHNFNVIVDTNAPEAFEVIADPAVWTNNTQPVITFNTIDQVSGISHYQLKIDDGEYLETKSPYQLPAQSDGEHTITVKAVDKAGWETISNTKVYIDTTPPIKPENFRVIPGNAKIILKWDASSEDVVKYLIAKNNGESTEITDQTDYFTINDTEYIDNNLSNGKKYTYQILAIDRAGNRSQLTEWKTATVGLTETPYNPEEGAIVEYEGVALAMSQEGLSDDIDKITVTELRSDELEEKMVYPQIGSMYEFSVYKEGKEEPEENMIAEEGYMGSISYDESDIPEGFPEQNLGVYHYDTMFGRWFKIPSAGVDVENNKIYFITNHFSSFSVQATIIQDLTPQEYKDAGHSPLKTYSEHGGVTVSPQFGTASTQASELVLPGRNGFDFVLSRRYDTATARNDAFALAINGKIGFDIIDGGGAIKESIDIMKMIEGFKENTNWANEASKNILQILEEYLFNQGDFAYSMGQGWRINIPYVKAANSSMLLRTAEGNMHYINEMRLADVIDFVPNMHRTLKFEQHEGDDFTLYVEQVYSPVDITTLLGTNSIKSRWYGLGYKLIMKDGTTYELDGLGRTTKMTDPTGLNTIEYHYDGMQLDYIKDSVDRIIRFDYETELLWPRISRIWVENDPLNREVKYNVGSDNVLHSAVDVQGRESYYEYDFRLMYGGDAGFTVNILNIILKIVGGPFAELAGSVFGANDIELHGNLKAQIVQPMEEMKAPGQGLTKIHYGQPTLMYGSCDVNWFLFVPVSVTFSVNMEQYLLADRIEVYLEDGKRVKTTNYDYNIDYYKWHQPMNYQTVENDGKRKTIYRYKPAAKKRYRWEDRSFEIEDGFEIDIPMLFWKYHVLGMLDEIEIRDSKTNNTLQRQQYKYNMEKMRPKQIKTIRGSDYTQVNYQYDNWGNVEYSKEYSTAHNRENIVESWTYYLNADSSKNPAQPWKPSPYTQGVINNNIHTLPGGKLVKNYIPDGEGNLTVQYLDSYNKYNNIGQLTDTANWDGDEWLENSFEYYPEDGSLKQKTNPEGHQTHYDYDSHGFLQKITEEDIVDVQGNLRDIVSEFSYDYRTGWKEWEKNPRGYITEYEYDALGRTTTITAPDDDDEIDWIPDGYSADFRDNNPVTTIEYNDSDLYSIVTDPMGSRIKYDFDKLGNLVEEVKYDRDDNGNYQEAAVTTLEYDGWGNITAISDPNGNAEGPIWKYTTKYQYDALGNNSAIIYPDETEIQSDNPVKAMDYDYWSNLLTITNEEGAETEHYLDMNNRVVKEVKYNRKANYVVEKIISEQYYDGLGNQVIAVDPDGNKTVQKYNELNKLVRIDLPEEEFYENGNKVIISPYQEHKYNKAGFKVEDIVNIASNKEQITEYDVDNLGRVIRTSTSYTDKDGSMVDVVNEIYYDANGNKVKEVDANNTPLSLEEQKAYSYTYSARDKLLEETDLAGNTTSYTYDKADRRITMTDPRGNSGQYDGDFTLIYHYDDLNRLVMGELPKTKDDTEKPVVNLKYDPRGNLEERIAPDGGKSTYRYYPRNLLKTETVEGEDKSYTSNYRYDKAGNQTKIIDPDLNETIKVYDDLNRVIKIRYPEGNEEEIEYDKRGNKSAYEDGRDNRTEYLYDAYGRISKVTDAKRNETKYMYDRMGNLTLKVNRLGHETEYNYDELNRLVSEEDSLNNVTEYAYDAVGNRESRKDPNGTESSYQYYDNYLVQQITMSNGEKSHSISYKYDESGFQKEVQDGDVITKYNTYNGTYTPDPYGRIYKKTDIVDGQSFSTDYQYDIMGRVTGIKTPRGEWVEYDYNTIGELTAVPGYVTDTSYNSRGMLESVTAANGIINSYNYDMNGRTTDLSYNNQATVLKDYSLQYDNANNIVYKNDNKYNYDRLNQLVLADLKGKFENKPAEEEQLTFQELDDYTGQKRLENEVEQLAIVELDYAAGSIGVDLDGTFPITKLTLTPDNPVNRVKEKDIDIYESKDNLEYSRVSNWEYYKDEDGEITILFNEPVETRFIKLKSYFDERDEEFKPVNMAEFINTAEDLIKVYYYVTERIEQYDYDAGGNRIEATISQRHTETTNYSYYSYSNRLKSNGKYAYVYDDNGNLIKKGTSYTISGDSVTIDSEGEEYWEYQYDLLDRLISVKKNGDTVANYSYNHKGIRLKKENYDTTIYYVFGINDNVVYEQENGEYSEYIYVGGQHFARVDGELLSTETTTYYYHTDHLGSTVLVTNASAEIVWSSEYTPFGSLTMEEGEFGFQKAKKFTGKDLDEDIGLYYYNARWYDAEIGRFTSADTYKGELANPQTLNLYIYTANNPLVYVDPSGHAYYSRDWGKYTWHPETVGTQAWKVVHVVPGGKFVNWVVDQETIGDSTISETKALTSLGIDTVFLLAGAYAKVPKTSVTAYKLTYMIKAGIDTNEILSRYELGYNLYKAFLSDSSVFHEQALYQYIKLAGLERHLSSSARSLNETGEEVKKRIKSRVDFIDEYIEKSKGNVDLVDFRKEFEGYYNKNGNFVKGYLQNVENMEVLTQETLLKAYNKGTWYYEYEKTLSDQYINESQVSRISYTGLYNPFDGYHKILGSNYYDKNDKSINNEENLSLDLELNIEDYIK